MYDLDGNGYITRQEMLEIVTGENIHSGDTFLNKFISAIYKMVNIHHCIVWSGGTWRNTKFNLSLPGAAQQSPVKYFLQIKFTRATFSDKF